METMKYLTFLVFATFCFFNGSSSNIISTKTDEILDALFSKGLSIPSIDLGNENNINNITVSISDDSKKEVSGKDWGLDMNLAISKLQINGNYNFENLVIPNLFPFFGNGKFLIDLNGVKFNFRVNATDAENVNAEIFHVELQTSKVSFENLFNDQAVADFVCEILSNTIPYLIKTIFGNEDLAEVIKMVLGVFYRNFVACLIQTPTAFEECLRNITQIREFNFQEFAKDFITLTKQQLIKQKLV